MATLVTAPVLALVLVLALALEAHSVWLALAARSTTCTSATG